MLQAMKNKAASWVAKILAALLILSFGAWGITDYIGPQGLPTEVAEVGDSKISSREFNEQFRRSMDRLRSVFGATLDSQQARQLGLVDTAIDDLVTRRLLRLEADDLGLIIGDDQIRSRILQEAGFRNAAGQFDQQIFNQELAQAGMTEGLYVASLRSQITRSNLTDVIAAGSVAPKSLANALYRYRNEKRIAELVLISRSAMGRAGEPDDAALRAFHRENPAMFTAPEMRDITAIHLDPEEFAAEIKPSEDKLREEFENRLSSLSVPERRRIKQILVQDEAMARRTAGRLKQGGKFDAIAKEVSGKSGEALSLGLITFNDLPPEIASVAFKLAANATSEPIRSPLGWHILLVEKIEAGKTPKFEEVRATISRDVARELAVDGLVKLANRLEDSLAGGGSLEEAAAEINIKLVTGRSIDRRGRSPAGVAVKRLPKDAKILPPAFETAEREMSTLIETAAGGYFIARVDSVIPPRLRPLEKVRKQAITAWKLKRQDDAARKRAKEILDQVRAGASLSRVASRRKLKLVTTKPFTRFTRDANSLLPQSVAAKLFKVKRGGADMGPSETGYAVAEVKEIRQANPAAGAEAIKGLSSQIGSAIAGDLLAQFSMALRDRFPVTINREAINTLFNEGNVGRY